MNGIMVSRVAITAWGWLLIAVILIPVWALLGVSLTEAVSGYLGTKALVLVWNTLLLAVVTMALACFWGVTAAWLVEMCVFPGRKLFAFVLFLPFAVPPYVQALYLG